MTRRLGALCAALLLNVLMAPRLQAQAPLIVEDVRVHGNHATPDTEVLRIAAIVVGVPLESGALEAARARLEASGRFSSVDLRTRRRSIADPSRLAVVILVAEHAGVRPAIDLPGSPTVPALPGVLGRLRSQSMFLPILGVEDGYGLTYGLRTSLVGGRRSATRVSFPASWGGTRQLAVEVERSFTRARRTDDADLAPATGLLRRGLTRVRGSAGLWRQEHPFFEQGQFRRYVDAEVTYRPRPLFGIGATAGTAAVAFGDVDDRMTSVGLVADLDTRTDPLFPRNAVYVRSALSRVSFAHPERSGVADADARIRWRHDVRGYLGVVGQLVLAARVQLDTSDGPLPAYAQPIFGGADTLRGIRAGSAVGDNRWAATLEARAPLSSVLRTTKLGVLAFYDTGATWNHGTRWRDGDRIEGVGGGVFLVNPFVQLQLSVARGLGRSTRVHFATGVAF